MKIHQYNIDGSYIGEVEVSAKTAKEKQALKTALSGYKGYGFYEDKFVSKEKVTVMTKEQERKHFDKWINGNEERIRKSIKAKYREWCEDCWQETLLYVYECMLSPRGVNDPENSMTFKYTRMLIDSGRKRQVKSKTILPDIDIYDSDFDAERSYIDTFAEESATQVGEDRCTIDVNNEEKFRIVIEKLMQHFDRQQINIWANYYMYFIGVKKVGSSNGYDGTAKLMGVSKSKVRDVVKLIDEKIKELKMKEEMLKTFEIEMYRDVEDWGLKELITNQNN